MSWFDGVIPRSCRDCFYFQDGQWHMYDHIECDDSCERYLAMFPVFTADNKLDHAKLDILSNAQKDPIWRMETAPDFLRSG